jgi:hypothetical protein
VTVVSNSDTLNLGHGAALRKLLEHTFKNIAASRAILDALVEKLIGYQSVNLGSAITSRIEFRITVMTELLDGSPREFVDRVQKAIACESLNGQVPRADCHEEHTFGGAEACDHCHCYQQDGGH